MRPASLGTQNGCRVWVACWRTISVGKYTVRDPKWVWVAVCVFCWRQSYVTQTKDLYAEKSRFQIPMAAVNSHRHISSLFACHSCRALGAHTLSWSKRLTARLTSAQPLDISTWGLRPHIFVASSRRLPPTATSSAATATRTPLLPHVPQDGRRGATSPPPPARPSPTTTTPSPSGRQ